MLRKTSHSRVQSTAGRDTFANYKLLLASFNFFFAASVEDKSVEEESAEEKFWIPARHNFFNRAWRELSYETQRTLAYRHLICRDKQRERKIAISLIGSYHWLAHLGIWLFFLLQGFEELKYLSNFIPKSIWANTWCLKCRRCCN